MREELPLRQPRSCGELVRVFTRMSLQGFGGVLPIAQRELVERERWLTKAQFVEILSLGQVLPGPNVMNVALIFGDRHFGMRGALAAALGMLAVPTVIVLALAALYAGFSSIPWVAGALRGMGVVAAGLVIATGLKLLSTLKANPLGRPLAATVGVLTFGAVVGLRWPLIGVVPAIGLPAVLAAWWILRRPEKSE